MKKLHHIFIVLILASSCGSVLQEEIYLNKDGSGEYLMYTDLIGAMRDMMSGMMGEMKTRSGHGQLNERFGQ